MLNFNRRDQPEPVRDNGKPTLKSSLYNPASPSSGVASNVMPRASTAAGKEGQTLTPTSSSASTLRDTQASASAAKAEPSTTTPPMSVPELTDSAGSKLCVGINIKLRGVEISDCDVLVIEGQVEATVHSKVMQIAQPGTLKGTANIDVAEIDGEFSGELTARTRLVVKGTGRVSGTIRYGKLVVAEGGELTGDVKRLDASAEAVQPATPPSTTNQPQRHLLRPETHLA